MNTPSGKDMPMPNNNDNNGTMMMMMQMSFYWGRDAIVLFSGWPKHSVAMYILAILFVFFLAMTAEVLINQPHVQRGTSPVRGAMVKAIVYLFRIGFLYLVMLSVMSFNVGIFIAAVVGHTLGFFISKSRSLAIANSKREEPKV